MMDDSDKRRRPHPYGFPFPPYHVQEALMADIYKCLDDGGVGMFESPTGTGKSLSLICSTLQWLLDHKKQFPDDSHDPTPLELFCEQNPGEQVSFVYVQQEHSFIRYI